MESQQKHRPHIVSGTREPNPLESMPRIPLRTSIVSPLSIDPSHLLFGTSRHSFERDWMLNDMANIQNIIITLMVIMTGAFLFMGQTAEAAKGPKITHKVSEFRRHDPSLPFAHILCYRSISMSNTMESLWVELSWDYTARLFPRLVS